MKCISLFSAIEGFGIAASFMNWELVPSVEWEKFPQVVIQIFKTIQYIENDSNEVHN